MEVISVHTGKTGEVPVESSLELKIVFELDRDVVAGYWTVKLLVDSCDARIIKVLGETGAEDYPDGESDMYFSCDAINLQGVSPSALTNSGLLIATFMADGKEVAAVNCVVNVTKNSRGEFMREIFNPLE